ncbi:MAG: polysaccharide biosynthesis tyrosine autokinase [Chloroflexi bacterium]|nr:polysaccharide biosynthesis tyrosine autokinase [Chloroflexota bacterium]
MEPEASDLDLRYYLEVLINWWWLVLLLPLLVGLVVFLTTPQASALYEAEARILVQQRGLSTILNWSDIDASEYLARTYTELITESSVLEEVAHQLALNMSWEDLRSSISVSTVKGTSILEIRASHSDADLAAKIANTVANVFINRTEETRLTDVARLQALAQALNIEDPSLILQANLSALGSLTLIREATRSTASIRPLHLGIPLLAMVLAGIVAVVGAFVLESLGGRLPLPEQLKTSLGLDGVEVVPRWSKRQAGAPRSVITLNPGNPMAEPYYGLLARLDALAGGDGGPNKVILVTSTSPSEGKSTTAVNLAHALALASRRVLLVDADMRNPDIHKWFGLPNQQGFQNLLALPDKTSGEGLSSTSVPGLSVIVSGMATTQPAELLARGSTRGVVEALKREFAWVIVDCPPLFGLSDTLRLVPGADGVVLVADAGRTRSEDLERAANALREVNHRAAPLFVILVLNKVPLRRFGYYSYYRSYYKSYYRRVETTRRRRWRTGALDTMVGWFRLSRRD